MKSKLLNLSNRHDKPIQQPTLVKDWQIVFITKQEKKEDQPLNFPTSKSLLSG